MKFFVQVAKGQQHGGGGHRMAPRNIYRTTVQDAPGVGYEIRAQVRPHPTPATRGRLRYSKIDVVNSSMLRWMLKSSVTAQFTATWQARLGAMPWAIIWPA